jgi:hypothetical protein
LGVANKIKKAAADKLKSLTDEHASVAAEIENKTYSEKLSALQRKLNAMKSSTKGSANTIEE